MCNRCMEGMINSLNTDVTDRHGNKLKRSRCHILEYMTQPKMKCVIDFSTCHHDAKEGFQEESDFTYLKKSYRTAKKREGSLSS